MLFLEGSAPTNTVSSSSGSSSLYTSTVQPGPSAPSANAALPPHPRLQIFYSPSAHFVSPLYAPYAFTHVSGNFHILPASSLPFRLV